jgi:preprotein translocase subunit SecE
MRNLPWVILTDVVIAILTMLVMSAALHSGFARFGVADFRVLGTPIALSGLLAFLSGVATFLVLVRNRRAMTFTDEVIGELFKVTWPSREETLRASITVVVTTVFTASLLAAYDFLWKNVADYFLFSGS